MKTLLISLVIVSLGDVKCFAQDEFEYLQMKPRMLISSGQFASFTNIIYKNCEFELVKSTAGDSTYLSTSDVNFITPEGFKVGNTWGDIDENYRLELARMPGWAYYIELDSGWQLGFCEGQSCTDLAPINTSRIKWIFRRSM
ncbi:MAG: hypothetical protein ACI837_001254 [Crocinitomicaceae bacterium]|jgi:hypothetical protein